MSVVKGLVIALSLTVPAVAALSASGAAAAPNKEALKAMLDKCSREADVKGLDVKKGKGEERKTFRRECMKKMGVESKK